MTVSHIKFGEVLKKLRTKKKLTQEEISGLLNVDRSNVANYEAGKRLPPIDSLIKIAAYFNVSLDYMILGKEVKTPKGDIKNEAMYWDLMAENTALMENEMKLRDLIQEKENEIKVLKDYIESYKKYNTLLESKLAKKDQKSKV